mgnify:CR=1 FL=1
MHSGDKLMPKHPIEVESKLSSSTNAHEIAPLLLNDKQAANWLGISRATFWRRVADGTFPRPIRIGGATRWRRDELMAAIERETVAQRETAA